MKSQNAISILKDALVSFPWIIFATSLITVPVPAQAQEEAATHADEEIAPHSAEEMTVTADRIRDESERMSRASQSITIQPQESSRFDTATQLKRESSLTFTETGRIAPSGFVIPRIRGQDAKLTDVYLEDTLLQDPYSGYPLVEDLDLRAFGSLELHQGVSPISVPNINPIGTLRYRFSEIPKSRASFGLTTGSPYGLALWGLGIQKSKDSEFRLYARSHQTTGRYRFYSDEGTPYNTKDDRRELRANNDQRSEQIIPIYRKNWGPYSLQALTWFYQADRGIPSNSMVLGSTARDKNKGYLADVSLSRAWEDLGLFESFELGMHVAKTDDTRKTDDPEHRVLNSSDHASMEIGSDRQGVHLKGSTVWTRTSLSYEQAQSQITQTFDGIVGADLERKNQVALLGLAVSPLEKLLLEVKHADQRQKDSTGIIASGFLSEAEKNPKTQKQTSANTVSLAWGDFEDGIYGQLARSQRLPSLYEEFGNGNTVRPNHALKPEKIDHRELGAFTTLFGLEWGAALYQDAIDDKIVFIPILANASKALNVAETEVRGYDGSATWHGSVTTLSFKISALDAYDTSRPEKRHLPAIPERIMVMEWRQQWAKDWSSFLTSRYRSDVYRDLGNSIKLPGAFVYDGNVDYKYRRFEIGLSLRNLLNTTDVEIASSTSKGRTGFSDISGSPLPGRQWILSLVYNTSD